MPRTPKVDGGYDHELSMHEAYDSDEQTAPDVTMHKARNKAIPLHEILTATGHHDMAKLVKKHTPNKKMHISSMHISKGKKGL